MDFTIEVEKRRHAPATPWTYAALDARQREIAARARAGGSLGKGALLLSEVAPVITLGRRADLRSELRDSPPGLAGRGIEIERVGRGGFATYHGPGQWVLFAVDRLEALTGDRRGVRRAVEGLLEIALRTSRAYEPMAEIREGAELGVWSPRGKLASVGVQVEQGVLLHGVAINGFRTPQSFVGLRPCGLEGASVDFLLGPDFPDIADDAEFERLGARARDAAFEIFWR